MAKDWKKEVARDIIALGSIVFYVLVIVRAFIGPYFPFVYQLIISLFVLIVFSFFVKRFDSYVARGLILGALTSIFYMDLTYTIFVSVIFIMMLAASYYLGEKKENIIYGLIGGTISTLVGYYLGGFIPGF